MGLSRYSIAVKVFDTKKKKRIAQTIIRDVECPEALLTPFLKFEQDFNKATKDHGLEWRFFVMTYPCTNGCLCYRCKDRT